jgi:2-keto-3-deoxy-L-rhamnonate aldolase RhmA
VTDLSNSARDRLLEGKLSLGLAIKLARGVEIAKVMKTAGYDWLFIDLEHGAMSIETASQIAITALDVGIAPLVRVPKGEFALATRLLDTGAMGIVMPHVDSAAEAREVVQRLKYFPMGRRSVASVMPQFDFKPVKIADLVETINRTSLVVVMIESPEAVADADAIAAVEGVDVLLIGVGDLSNELGLPGGAGDPRVLEAVKKVAAASKAHGKWFGFGGVGDAKVAASFIAEGARFILAGADAPMLIDAASKKAAALRANLDPAAP